MQVREGHITPDKHPAPDERADVPEDDAELVDTERCSGSSHALRVAQSLTSLKGVPRYLALSLPSVMFILEFPSAEQAKAWYNDPAYAELTDLRQTGADAEIVVLTDSSSTL